MQTRTLAPGQMQSFYLVPGDRLVVLSGSVRLHEPALWLADQVHWPRRSLGAGQVFEAEQRGALQLETAAGTALVGLEPRASLLRALTARVISSLRAARARPSAS